MLRNKWAQAWVDAGKEPLPMPFQGMISGPVLAAAHASERSDIHGGFAGQGMGLIREIRPAADVLREMAAQTEETLSRAREML